MHSSIPIIACCVLLAGSAFGKQEFNFQILKKPIVLKVKATAYTHTESDHVGYGAKTAYGSYLQTGVNYHSAAADWSFLPIGTVFRIRGYGPTLFVIDDYGSALTGKTTVDIYFKTKREMNRWGAPRVEIEVVRIGDFRASYRILKTRAGYWHCYEMAKRIYDRYAALHRSRSGNRREDEV